MSQTHNNLDPNEPEQTGLEAGIESEPTAGAAEGIDNKLSKKDSVRLRRIADGLFWRAFTQDKEK